jgi:hypothetical protein
MAGRVTEAASVAAVAVVLTIVMAGPVLRSPHERIFGRESVGRHHDPFTVMEQFDRPLSFGVYLQPVTDVPGALAARAVGPVAAYNWIVLMSFPLSALAMWALARYLNLSLLPSALAALAFAFSPFHLAHAAYHPHIAQTQWMPLFLVALCRCLDAPTLGAFALLVVSVVGVTLSNYYGGLIAAVMTPVLVVSYWAVLSRHHERPFKRLAWTASVLGLLALAGAVYAWVAAGRAAGIGAIAVFPRDALSAHSAKWWSYLVPPVSHPVLGQVAEGIWRSTDVAEGILEQQVSLGWGIVALGTVAVCTWAITRRRAPALASVPFLAPVVLTALMCSLSPERTIGSFTFPRPSAWLYAALPMFRAYARFGLVVQLIAVLLAAIGADVLWRSGWRGARTLCLMLVALAVFEYVVWPSSLVRDVLPTSAHRWAARQPATVRVLDCAPLTPESASIQWLSHNRVLLGRGGLSDCGEPDFAGKLAAAGYTHMIPRAGAPESGRASLLQAVDGLGPVTGFRKEELLAVTAPAPALYTAEMTGFYGREWNGTETWRWMARRGGWLVEHRGNGQITAFVNVEMSAFAQSRRLRVLLDGRTVQTLVVDQQPRSYRIGPLAMSPGDHELAFEPLERPDIADDHLHNGDRRVVSVQFGDWQWSVVK